jgi:LPXTG-motif cell wall-anchored protein
LSGAATGVWDVTVAYEGTYTKIGAFTVYQPGLTQTSLAVSSSVNPSIYGQSVNFTAAVTPSTATGTVEFSVDDVPFGSPVTISGGSAVLVGITNLSVTTGHTVTARYSGDSTYSGSTGTLSGGQTVTPAPTATSITPNAAVNTGTVNITNLAGTGFLTGAAVQLQKNGQNPIGATSVVVVTESQITCNFDLTGALAGAWNVVVINPDTQTATLANGFTVYSVSQKWYLDNKGDYVMEKTGTQTGSVSISNGSNAIWLSDQQAATDVTFSSGTWTVNLKTDADWSGTCSAQVGDYNAGTSKFTPFNSSPGTGAYSNGVITITVTTGGTVSAGDYLALKIFNNSGALHNITTDGSSWLSSPVTDPGYPLPEMPALVLLGIGLVGLGGYVYVKKSRNDRFAKG